MKALLKSHSLAIGLAMFSMFFGAGNIIYPLAVGQYAGDRNFFAICGLIITAVIMPIAGVIAMILCQGEYRRFFGRLGSKLGFAIALLTISLLGPLGSTPRCIALSFTTLKGTLFELSPTVFSALACILIFLFTVKKNQILRLLGWILTPALLLSLFSLILLGLFTATEAPTSTQNGLSLFLHGLSEGYNTMDLLAAFFFSSTILNILKKQCTTEVDYFHTAWRASLIGGVLLTLVYIGFSYTAAFHAHGLSIHGKDELLSAIAIKIAGPYASLLVTISVALACLTTAIALITAFTDFIRSEIFKDRISYPVLLLCSLSLTFLVSTFEFTGISTFLWPILTVIYPGLIALTLLNIALEWRRPLAIRQRNKL